MTRTLCFAVIAPFGRDGELIQRLLVDQGAEGCLFTSVNAVCDALANELCDAVVLTEEALPPQSVQILLDALQAQPTWSDIPLAVMVSGGSMTHDMAALVERLGASANLTYIERPVRAATLRSTFNSMIRARLRQYEVRDLIEAHAAAEQAERVARQEAEQATRMRDEFLGVASHELRTPLTVMLGQTQRLARKARDGRVDTDALLASLEDVYGNALRLEQLISDLLDTSRIQQGRLMLHLAPLALDEFAADLLERCKRDLLTDDTHQLVLDVHGPVHGRWDEGRIEQMLINLLTNAIKYSPDGGTITLTVRAEGDEATLEVSDEGLGIPPDRIGDLFQPFVRLHEDYRVAHGTGLGLYITDQLVRRHGGRIEVANEPTRGTRFTIHLPMLSTVNAGDSTGLEAAPPPHQLATG